MEEPFSEGNSAGIVISQDELEKMLTEYYSLRGWDEQGIPKQKVAD
jgi:aldehyde:ferredoxin oxidoreductase